MARPAFKTAAESFPRSGNRELSITLDFTNVGTIFDDLSPEMQQSEIETIQSLYIDNSANPSPFTITFFPSYQSIVAQPFTQGIYPVICWGRLAYKAVTSQGIKIPVIFSNTAKTFAVWGPVPGVTVTPALTNLNFDVEPMNAGDNQLVAGVANETVKLYRGIFSVGAATLLKFTDGPAGTVLFTMFLQAGGSLTFEPSGIPWFVTSAGNALTLNSSNAVNGYGGFGYVQS
jgi:hypothetical protein